MTSIVRRGNHFIRLENEWCLIDGPWFDYLERLSNGSSVPVRLAYFGESPCIFVDRMTADEMYEHISTSNIQEVEWLPKQWHPGVIDPWKGKAWATARELYLHDRWHEWLVRRTRTGYTLLPDGKLPEFLAAPVLQGDEDAYWWYDAWDWYDAFEYYVRGKEEVKRLDGKEE